MRRILLALLLLVFGSVKIPNAAAGLSAKAASARPPRWRMPKGEHALYERAFPLGGEGNPEMKIASVGKGLYTYSTPRPGGILGELAEIVAKEGKSGLLAKLGFKVLSRPKAPSRTDSSEPTAVEMPTIGEMNRRILKLQREGDPDAPRFFAWTHTPTNRIGLANADVPEYVRRLSKYQAIIETEPDASLTYKPSSGFNEAAFGHDIGAHFAKGVTYVRGRVADNVADHARLITVLAETRMMKNPQFNEIVSSTRAAVAKNFDSNTDHIRQAMEGAWGETLYPGPGIGVNLLDSLRELANPTNLDFETLFTRLSKTLSSPFEVRKLKRVFERHPVPAPLDEATLREITDVIAQREIDRGARINDSRTYKSFAEQEVAKQAWHQSLRESAERNNAFQRSMQEGRKSGPSLLTRLRDLITPARGAPSSTGPASVAP